MNVYGLMFHHFHDKFNYKKSEGSINQKQLKSILLNFKKNIVKADEFLNSLDEKNKSSKKMICLTFDDSIKSQANVALEVLDDLKMKAFFFVNTFQFENKLGLIECCRYFRNNYFSSVEEFNNFFIEHLKSIYTKKKIDKFISLNKNFFIKMKKISPFYSYTDLEFRLLRDFFLKNSEYSKILIRLFELKNFDYKKENKKLHFNRRDLLGLIKKNHEIGLHSHSHPIPITDLPKKKIQEEYNKNYLILNRIINKRIVSMSHPNGYFNKECKAILKNLNIKIGFANSYKGLKNKKLDPLNIPRVDHSSLI
tara:strand:+ start:1079 stop:2005 length:927 start_codon:yes stop_codon:yes gene_type:complete